MENKELTVAFVGNPNCGKTTLFNAYTGARLKVANWPGVTVEKKEGMFPFYNNVFRLIDLPGIYSLTSYTMEEKLSRQFLLGEDDDSGADVIVDVADASCLERNLYLTLQLIELGKPIVLALNMIDIVEKRGMKIDLHRLSKLLGIPVVPISARRRSGLEELMHAVAQQASRLTGRTSKNSLHGHVGAQIRIYHSELESKIAQVTALLAENYPNIQNPRWTAIKLLEQDEEISARYPVKRSGITVRNLEPDFTKEKFDFIETVIAECLVNKECRAAATDQIDAVLTHRFWGVPIFFAMMAAVFLLTFTLGDALKSVLETGLDWFSGIVSGGLATIHIAPWMQSLIVDGIISGVGGILTFLPNIFILFLALAFLEDSGYMSRVAYVMDGIMGALGLSGRAFIPMLLGFGCTVPAIMASRTLENKKDRMRTILITPFMSCSARLPVYVLLSGAFFGNYATLAALSMYALGLLVAMIVAKLANLADCDRKENALLIELPEYKTPSARTVIIYVWEKIKDYLTKAGTVIFIASIILWFVLNIGPCGMTETMEDSFGAMLGKWIAPLLTPCGLGLWQIAVALIAGIAAKEVVVSSLAVLFGIANITSGAGMTALSDILVGNGFGALNAYALMAFVLLYVPCAATLATIKNETKSWPCTVFAALFQILVAWIVSALIYTVGRIIL